MEMGKAGTYSEHPVNVPFHIFFWFMNHISVLHTKKLKEVKKVFLLFGPVILLLIIEFMETGKQSHVHTNELFVVLF